MSYDELALSLAVFHGIHDAFSDDLSLSQDIGGPERGVGAEPVAEVAKHVRLRRGVGDHVDMEPKRAAVMLNRTHSHRPVFRERIARRLPLESEQIQDCLHIF